MGVRLGVVKQSFFGLPGQYGHRVTKANGANVLLARPVPGFGKAIQNIMGAG